METIKIQYLNDEVKRLEYIGGKSDWIDLRSAEHVVMKKGEFHLIPLGVAMQLPNGYEAHIVPRSSTYKNFGIIQVNHMGVVDESTPDRTTGGTCRPTHFATPRFRSTTASASSVSWNISHSSYLKSRSALLHRIVEGSGPRERIDGGGFICVQTRKKISNKKAEWQRLCFFIAGKFLYAVITVPVFPR